VCLKTGLHVIQEPLEIKRPNVTLEGESPGTRVQRQGGIAVLRIRHPQGAVVSDVRVEGIRFEGGGAAGADAVVAISNGRNGGIQLGDGVFGACEITDNTFDHYWIGVQVGGRAEETVVARNRIRRAPLPASLATTSTDLAFAIDVAAPHCLVADNWIELNDPL